jgi:hypothetical protein
VMLHGVVMHRLLNKKHDPLGRAPLESAVEEIARSACPCSTVSTPTILLLCTFRVVASAGFRSRTKAGSGLQAALTSPLQRVSVSSSF